VYLCVCATSAKKRKKNNSQESTKEILKICKCAEGNLNNFRAKLNVCTSINLCWKHFVSIEYQFIDLIDHFVNRWFFYWFAHDAEMIFFPTRSSRFDRYDSQLLFKLFFFAWLFFFVVRTRNFSFEAGRVLGNILCVGGENAFLMVI